jgi:hypothetical protein
MEKAQPRTETATLTQWAKDLSGYFMQELPTSKRLNEIADRLEEQEATIRHLRVEICNASAVAMENREMALKLKRSVCDTFVELRDLRETIARLRY